MSSISICKNFKEFNDYFNGGNYVKDTYINIDINKDAVKDELADIVHAYDPVNKIDVDKSNCAKK